MISHNHQFRMQWLSTMMQDITTPFGDGNNIGAPKLLLNWLPFLYQLHLSQNLKTDKATIKRKIAITSPSVNMSYTQVCWCYTFLVQCT